MKARAGNNDPFRHFLTRRDKPAPLPCLGAAAPTGGQLLAGKDFASGNACPHFLIVLYFRLKEFNTSYCFPPRRLRISHAASKNKTVLPNTTFVSWAKAVVPHRDAGESTTRAGWGGGYEAKN